MKKVKVLYFTVRNYFCVLIISKEIFQDYMDAKKEHLLKYKFVNGWLENWYWD